MDLKNIKKIDFIVIASIMLLSVIAFIAITLSKNEEGLVANVYYKNDLILEIDLYKLNTTETYVVDGYNGDVVIEARKNEIRVVEETSPRNICSKQGWSSSDKEPIICLPNYVYIKVISETENNGSVDVIISSLILGFNGGKENVNLLSYTN